MTDTSVAELLAVRAAGQPLAVAVEHGDHQVSYGELVTGLRDVAAAVAQVAARGEVVAVDGRPGPSLIMAAAGVMATGRVLLLLDPELTARMSISSSSTRVVLHSALRFTSHAGAV